MNLYIPTHKLSLDYFRDYAQLHSNFLDKDAAIIEFIVAFSERALISGNDHEYYDPYFLTQLVSGAQGYCFMDPSDLRQSDLDGIAGKNVFEILPSVPKYIQISILDAVFHHINIYENIKPSATYEFNGLAFQKSMERAKKIVELAEIVRGCQVAMIGGISDIVRAILDKKAKIEIADFALAGTEMEGVKIKYNAIPLINNADVILMTGNTLKTDTLGQLLDLSQQLHKRVVIYAMSGANIAPRYLDYGASVVTSEPFPYYWYAHIPSTMNVYIKNQ